MADILRFTLQTASQAAAILKRETLALEKNIRISGAQALTATAKIAVQDLGQATDKFLDRPVRWTKRGFFFLPANKRNKDTATVGIKDERGIGQRGTGTPAVFYLQPNVESGPRNAKGIEKKLRGAGYLRANEYIVPGRGARLDRYGNIPRRVTKQLVEDLGRPYTQRQRFFYNPNLTPRGIWERYGRGRKRARPYLLFTTRRPTYQKIFPFYKIVERTFDKHLDREFEKAFERGLQRARDRR